LGLVEAGCGTSVQSVPNPPQVAFLPQTFQPPENCLLAINASTTNFTVQ
jgi:hypothetical protein